MFSNSLSVVMNLNIKLNEIMGNFNSHAYKETTERGPEFNGQFTYFVYDHSGFDS